MKTQPLVLGLAFALVFAVAIVSGLIAAILSAIGGTTPAHAALRGGAAFGAALAIGIAGIAALM